MASSASETDTEAQAEGTGDQSVSSADFVYEEILKRIVQGVLREGSPLRGSTIAAELGVSRTPVAQAIARLVAEGVLNQELNHRAIVATGAERWFISVHEVRILLEPAAAAASAGSVPAEQLEKLEGLSEAVNLDADSSQLRDAAFRFDHALHNAIAECSGNLLLKSIIQKCMSFKRFAYRVPNDPLERLTRSHHEHLQILKALKHGDSEFASSAMLLHLRSTVSELPDHHVV